MLSPLFALTDRRPVGILQFADESHRSATNPASWLFDPTIDVVTPAGIAEFQKRFLAWGDASIANLLRLNAQVGINWSMDGGRFETYLGSPDIATTLNPELEPVADEYCHRMRLANLKPGFAIRCDEWNPITKKLEASPNPYKTLLRKMTYAYQRWHARWFYIDTNMWDWRVSEELLPSIMFDLLRKQLPGSVIIAEHEKPPGYTLDDQRTFWNALGYYRGGPQYMAANIGELGTPASIRALLPGAMAMVNVNAANLSLEQMKGIVANGDLLAVDASWWSDAAEKVMAANNPS